MKCLPESTRRGHPHGCSVYVLWPGDCRATPRTTALVLCSSSHSQCRASSSDDHAACRSHPAPSCVVVIRYCVKPDGSCLSHKKRCTREIPTQVESRSCALRPTRYQPQIVHFQRCHREPVSDADVRSRRWKQTKLHLGS